ncbi:MAG: HtaA domain-containing protein [Pseudolysinimonas sp.]
MTRFRPLAAALAGGLLGLGMLGPAAAAAAPPSAESVVGMIGPGCDVTDATLTWGFKESFRAYIDGDIANGEWTTAGGATYETPSFIWSDGQGRYDPDTGYGHAQFLGTVRFTGHDGLLDTTIADPILSIEPDGAVLILDVSGPSMEGDQIDADDVGFVDLPGVEVSGEGARLTLSSASVLTDDGEAAFPDYAAGTAFDPVDVALELDQCSPAGGYAGGDDVSPAPAPHPLVIALAVSGPLLVVAAIVAVVAFAVRRRARA